MGRIMRMQSLLRRFIMVKIQMPFLGLNQRAAYQMPQNDDSIEITQVRKLHMASPGLHFMLWWAMHFYCPILNLYETISAVRNVLREPSLKCEHVKEGWRREVFLQYPCALPLLWVRAKKTPACVRVRGSDRTCSRQTRPHNKQQSWGSILKIASCIMRQRSCGRISTASFRVGKLFHSNLQQLGKCHCAAGRLGLCFLFLNWTKFNWALSSRIEMKSLSLPCSGSPECILYLLRLSAMWSLQDVTHRINKFGHSCCE